MILFAMPWQRQGTKLQQQRSNEGLFSIALLQSEFHVRYRTVEFVSERKAQIRTLNDHGNTASPSQLALERLGYAAKMMSPDCQVDGERNLLGMAH